MHSHRMHKIDVNKSSGESMPYWLDTVPALKFPKLSQSMQTEVCVVGAGIAGLTVGYLLSRSGKRVTVIDDGEIVSGETGRTTAHLQSAVDDRFYNLEWMFGDENTKLVADSHRDAIDMIESITQYENIHCDFKRVSGYLFNRPRGKFKELEDELAAASRAGFQNLRFVDRVPIEGFDSGPAIEFPRQGQFHPMKYMNALAKAIVDKYNGEIFTSTHASAIHPKNDTTIEIPLSNGHMITCEYAVIATNVPINDTLKVIAKLEPYRSYVIAGLVPKDVIHHALFWDTCDPYHYVRLQPHSATHDVMIIGGEDHKVGKQSDYEDPHRSLEAWTRARFPMYTETKWKWSGQVIEPADYIAYIGHNPRDHQNIYIATGDSGNGMTHCTLAGMIIHDLILGRHNKYAKLYDPLRKTIKSIPSTLLHLADVNIEYKDYVTPGEVSNIEDLPLGCGAVMRKGLMKYAVYKDEQGQVHSCSAICPHLKGIVKWNPVEKTFDCPVHGSRFSKLGNVLNGPANSDLTRNNVFQTEE